MSDPDKSGVDETAVAAIAQRMFGRRLSESELQAIGVRLAGVPRILKILNDWQAELGAGDPATVFRVPPAPQAKRAGHD